MRKVNLADKAGSADQEAEEEFDNSCSVLLGKREMGKSRFPWLMRRACL